MAKKHAGPWLRKSDLNWYTTVNGRLIRLGSAQDEPEAINRAYLAAHGAARITVGDLVARFLLVVKSECAPATYAWYARFLVAFCKCQLRLDKIGGGRETWIIRNTPAADIASFVATAWIKQEYGECSPSTQNGAARSLCRMFNWAVDANLFTRSPIKGLRKVKATRREFFADGKHYALCLKHCGENLRDAIKFLKHTGCRPQELRAIEAKWIKDHKVLFPYQVKRKDRVIYLDDMASRIASKLSAKWPTGPIFRSTDGKPWSKDGFIVAFRRLREATGLPMLCAYSFRHGYITKLLENGVDVATVAAISGNSARMVLDVYNHAGQNENRLRRIVQSGGADAAAHRLSKIGRATDKLE